MGRSIKDRITNADKLAEKEAFIKQQREDIEKLKHENKVQKEQIDQANEFMDSLPKRLDGIQEQIGTLNRELQRIRANLPEQGPKVEQAKVEGNKSEPNRKDSSSK